MRIVIDGAAGGGKSTFLGTVNNNQSCPTIRAYNYTVFEQLIRSSLDEGIARGICPPKNEHDWNELFSIMFNIGKTQHESGSGSGVYWYDRGLPFIEVFAMAHDVCVSPLMHNRICEYRYDYVFVFKPIETYDLFNDQRGKLRPLTMKDRCIEHERVCSMYRSIGHNVYEVPVYSDNYLENFNMRLSCIEKVIGMTI